MARLSEDAVNELLFGRFCEAVPSDGLAWCVREQWENGMMTKGMVTRGAGSVAIVQTFKGYPNRKVRR